MVPGGRWHGASKVRSVRKAALRPISLTIGTGGDCAPSCAGQFDAGNRSAAPPSGVDDLARVAPQRCHPGWRSGVSCDTAQWHAERSARRPKRAKLVLNAALRHYVEERLAGVIAAPSGASVPGPAVSWKGRRHGPRQDRRWARASSPEQIARLPVDFPDDGTMRISHEALYQALFVQTRGALRREL